MKIITYDEWIKLSFEDRINFTGIVFDINGMKHYVKHGQRHREDGPALISLDGVELYYQNGKAHRIDGPAVIHPDGYVQYWINGEQISKEAQELYYVLYKLKGLL